MRLLAAAIMTWLCAVTNALAAKIYAISADTGNVYLLDTSDLSNPQLQFSLGAGLDFAGLAYSRERGTYFAFGRLENKFYEFDTAGNILNIITPDQTLVNGPTPRGITFDSEGRLFAVGFQNNIYEVNLKTGETTLQFQATGPTNQIEAIAALDNEAFLAVGVRSQVFLLDRNTGQLTNILSAGVPDLDAMTGTIGGWIYMADSNRNFHAFNPFTRQFQNLSPVPVPVMNGLVEFVEPPSKCRGKGKNPNC